MKRILLVGTAMIGLMGSTMGLYSVNAAVPGTLKVNVNYGLQQKEGSRPANNHFAGGDVIYTVTPKWNVQYSHHYARGNTGNHIQEQYVTGGYHLTDNLTAYAGGAYIQTEVDGTYRSASGYQFGVRGEMDLPYRFKGYANIGLGNRTQSYVVGVGYPVLPGIDAHVQYRNSKVDAAGYKDTVKGVQVGVGYSF
ncbi:porin family protein [uncultured Megasphaera sp.]|uniref:porin family protein n=1 Tax=uncultured Megasphaera sp. TaxID=165188 RepID=UPI002592F008|nr:porin family protein [uncultured Megasphaera sp.]